MKNLNFIAIDFETANEKPSSVCSLGLVIVKEGKIVEKKYRLIKPNEFRFSPMNIEVHGINPHDVIQALEFNKYWNSLKQIFNGQMLIAHNAGFDINVLTSVLDVYQLEYPDINYSCSLRTSRRTWKGLNSYSLGKIAGHFGYQFKHHHALEDAEMSAKLMIDACIENKVDSIELLNEKLNIQTGTLDSNKKHIKVKSL